MHGGIISFRYSWQHVLLVTTDTYLMNLSQVLVPGGGHVLGLSSPPRATCTLGWREWDVGALSGAANM
jgi:hypothetical protein